MADEWICSYCKNEFPTKELAEKHEKNCDFKDVLTEKWIEIEIGFSAYANSLMESRDLLNKWAKELGWEYKEDKKQIAENGRPCYPICISPKGRKISPKQFEEESDKLLSLSEQIARGFGNVDEQGVPYFNHTFGLTNLMQVGKKEAVMGVLHKYGAMPLNYPLYQRIKLEKANLELAKTIFDKTASQEINSIEGYKIKLSEHLFNKEEKERKKRLQERLKNWFGIEIY
jgi:hypothetical protein